MQDAFFDWGLTAGKPCGEKRELYISSFMMAA